MALVAYSDSESSDSEDIKTLPAEPIVNEATTTTEKTKTPFQKVVDQANPRKVKVNLAGLAAQTKESTIEEDDIEKDRPAKRTKTAGAFSGFNSFLPAPKNPNKGPSGASDGNSGITLSRSRGLGLGRGVSLKTGATPAFSRDVPQDSYLVEEEEDGDDNIEGVNAGVTQLSPAVVQEEVKLVGKPMMFKPLSVARKGPPKKKVKAEDSVTRLKDAKGSEQGTRPNTLEVGGTPAPKVKQSLFSTFDEDTLPASTLDDETRIDPTAMETPTTEIHEYSTQIGNTSGVKSNGLAAAPANSLSSLADNLGLSAAERRQLFGRNGSAQDAKVSSFSLAAEYSHNNKLLESEDSAPAHNPVRAIAPGKHSLQQLLNAATNQKEALEESFASGKRNRKDAGSRYGW